MSKKAEKDQITDQVLDHPDSDAKSPRETLHYRIATEDCLTHTFSAPKYPLVQSRHHDGRCFHNEIPRPLGRSRWALMRWIMTRKSQTWQVDSELEAKKFYNSKLMLPQHRPEAKMDDWQVWFVGHATVLIQIGPYNFLTDPVWADHVSPKQGMGPKRVCPAGIALEHLPHIHAVLLSHNHYDHMDLASLRWLHERFGMPIYTGLGNSAYLDKAFHVIEMDWWQSALLFDFKIIYTPAQHGSGRGLRDQNAALWGGFSIVSDEGHCFFAGDTGYSPHFKEIHKRLGAPRIALLPIGAYEPRQLMRYMHMNPQDAFQAHLDLHAKRSLAVHYRTFQLTDEMRDQPEKDLHQAMKNSSKLMNPFYCIKEGRKMTV
ncbi:L-ascorbate metabolism protein UlaG (beta-lactamase superfamily) [Acinetobacter calcoaceticus]|uniref:L-ascorbate metabolism protein UlaG (Beta-lactamase superfamily) n=1 Tax=Acinetobacter calcoaceticus TaxID=471 RepID=A0A4R1Y0U0_ACICA|nr:L-ascorbate metabolism protein UlaG (beta-lactamase superfamily) [Acinetobacter calcoaceticus]